jgi:hypothetical protein
MSASFPGHPVRIFTDRVRQVAVNIPCARPCPRLDADGWFSPILRAEAHKMRGSRRIEIGIGKERSGQGIFFVRAMSDWQRGKRKSVTTHSHEKRWFFCDCVCDARGYGFRSTDSIDNRFRLFNHCFWQKAVSVSDFSEILLSYPY